MNVAEIEHNYGDHVHLIDHPFAQSLLTRFSQEKTVQPELNLYLEKMYDVLLYSALNSLFKKEKTTVETRMGASLESVVLSNEMRVISVDLARAGIFPTHHIHHILNYYFNPINLRQDHFYVNRKVNEQGEVIGVNFSGSKIGGDKEGAYVLIPDPMAATGGSLSFVLDHYKNGVKGKELGFIALHLIITPEYIRKMQKEHPDLHIFALRVDRGASTPEVLQTIPGTNLEEEFGLNENDYILPGAGGVGEILNNSFI